METIDADFATLFKNYDLPTPHALDMRFNGHATHSSYESARLLYKEIPEELVHKLFYFYEADYLAFGYEEPWDWLKMSKPNFRPKTKPYIDFTAKNLMESLRGLPR